MKRASKVLLSKSIDSLILSIEYFNRPWDRGRYEAVLIMLDRAFELLLKAVIIHKGGRIREPRAKETIGFDKCVRKCISDDQLRCLTEDQAITVQIINSLRDAAQHYMLDISEQQLYLYTQAGVTLFSEILKDAFELDIKDYLPERVIPVSAHPPKAFEKLISTDFREIKDLVKPGSRKRLQARAKVRALAIVDASLKGIRSQPGENELGRILTRIKEGKSWKEVFPGIASLKLNTEGTGLNVNILITKSKGEAVHLVEDGTPGATVVAVKRVNELGYYSLGLKAIAKKIGLSTNKTLAVVKHLNIQDDSEYFKIIKVGSVEFKRYSTKALDLIKKSLDGLDVDQIWKDYWKQTYKGKKEKGK